MIRRFAPAPAWLALWLMLLGACASKPRPPQAPPGRAVALAVVMAHGGAPSPQQLTAIHSAMLPEITRLGLVYASHPRLADHVLHVLFTPDATGVGGQISVLNAVPPPRDHDSAIAARDRFRRDSEAANREQVREQR